MTRHGMGWSISETGYAAEFILEGSYQMAPPLPEDELLQLVRRADLRPEILQAEKDIPSHLYL